MDIMVIQEYSCTQLHTLQSEETRQLLIEFNLDRETVVRRVVDLGMVKAQILLYIRVCERVIL